MIKLLCSAAVFGLILASPANAMDAMKCDDASMMKMQTNMDAMNDPAMKSSKEMAMKHMEMAKTSMKAKKMDDCSAQMGMAQMSMMLKCDDASMAMMRTEMAKMKGHGMKANKKMAMKHMDLAKASMKAKKNDQCAMHMREAMDAMYKKM